MTALFYRDFHQPPRRLISGKGCWLTDANGKQYIDGSSGAAVSNIGHGVPEIAAAVHAQISNLEFAHSLFFSAAVQERLAEQLAQLYGGELTQSFFLSSGSEAVEAGIKLARQYHVEQGDTRRVAVIAREQAYHGNTFACLGLSGDLRRSSQFLPYLPRFEKVPAVYPYRHQLESETLEAYGERCVAAFEEKLRAVGPDTVSAAILETVVGSTLGAVESPPGYLPAIEKLCDEHGVLLILDEVFCGIGRTGTFGAYQQEGITPDIVTNAKGLSGGYQPLSSVSTTQRIVDAVRSGSGRLGISQTWMAHPTACAAGVATLDYLKRNGLIERVTPMGKTLMRALQGSLAEHPCVGDVRGRGLLTAVELVQDKATKQPFPSQRRLYERVRVAALDEGLVCWAVGGCADGTDGDLIIIAPPYIATEDELHLIAQKLSIAIDKALRFP